MNVYIFSVPTLDQVDPSDSKGKSMTFKNVVNYFHDINPCLLNIAVYAARNQKIRDDWVKAMEARLIKEKLDECYRVEGVNHCECFEYRCKDLSMRDLTLFIISLKIDKSCRDLADMYLKTIKTHRVEGFRKST